MRRVGAVAVLVAVVGASMVPLASPAGAKTKDPCKLLRRSQIAKVLGQPTGPPDTGEPPPLFRQCYWNLAATDDEPAASVGITVQSLAAKSTFDINRASQFAQRMPGIEQAFYDTDLRTLSALRGDVLVSVQLLYLGGEDVSGTPPEPELVRLAKAALRRFNG